MTIAIELRDFRGCERASLKVDPIALIAGRNATGKSSIAQAIAAAITGDPLVVDGVGKSAAGALVKTGAASASVTVAGARGKTRVEWPSCQATGDGTPPAASEISAGLINLGTLPARERTRVIGEILHAAPTREDLQAALGDLGLDPVLEPIWKLIEADGWEQAHAIRKDRGAQYKGQWRQVTGQNYGSRVAQGWIPKGWASADEGVRENDLLGDLAKAKHEHEQAIAATAVSDAEREQLMTAVELTAARRLTLRDAERAARTATERLEQATAARQALPQPEGEGGLPCPHCGALVVIRRISLVESVLAKVEPVPQAESKRRRLAIAHADGEISRLGGEARQAQSVVAGAQAALANSEAARQRLATLRSSDKSAGDVEAAHAAVETADTRLKAFRQKREADELRDKIVTNDKILDLLAPDGLRARKLTRVLDTFNTAQLLPLTEAAGWQPVLVEPDMSLTYGGRPYALCSTSEQYRLRAVLQVAMARLAGDDLVVFDAADVLDAPTRGGLFSLLARAEMRAVVCMTLSRREQVPDIATAGLGARRARRPGRSVE